MKKVVFYGRYSSVMQTEQSIEGQLHVCEQYAAENDLEIIRQYIDRAKSGTSDDRPEFQRMLSDSKSCAFEGVLVYKLDRFARSRYDSAIAKHKLRENGVRVISATEHLTDTPEGIIMEALLEGMDEYYSAELGRKMKRGKQESFRKGKFIGHRPPFGYAVVDHRLAIDPLTGPIAQEIFRRYAAGEKQNQILTDLNRRGIPNPKGNEWNKVNLTYMFANRIYIGEYAVSDYGTNECPALIDRELFDTVQRVKAESVHRSRENATGYDYMLTGRLVCGKCGGAVTGSSMQKGKYHYYQCYKHHCSNRVRAEQMHERVREALAAYLTEDKLDELAAAAYAAYEQEQRPASERVLLTSELADVEKKIENAVQAILNGVQLDDLNATIDTLKARREQLKSAIADAPTEVPTLTYEHFRLALEMIIEKANTEDFKALVCTVVNRIIVDDQNIIVCINLTDEANVPPLEQIMVRVKSESSHETHPILLLCSGWLLLAA